MDCKEFMNSTITIMNQDTFETLRDTLVGEYLSFSIISPEDVDQDILAEKLCDYFEKLELKTFKSFDKQIESYIKDIDSIIADRIAKTPKPKKKVAVPVVDSRARKYYNKAISTKNVRNLSVGNLVDYTRIMMGLYMAIINNQFKGITDLNYSLECLDPNMILEAMKNETDSIAIKLGKKNRFDIKELYCSDTGTFILTIILLYRIINNRVQGEYGNE